MTQRMDKESTSALVKLIIFCVLTGMATIVLGMTLSNGGFARRDVYKAMFTDVTGVAVGDEVRIAGVRVGTVRAVEIAEKDKAVVEFGIEPDVKLTQNTTATLRFRNLVGQRYMALEQDSEGATTTIQPGAVTPTVIMAALVGAIVWNLITWWLGLPSSSSHALMGGFAGAAVTHAGTSAIIVAGWIKPIVAIVLSPMLGMLLGLTLYVSLAWLLHRLPAAPLDTAFRRLQLVSAAL